MGLTDLVASAGGGAGLLSRLHVRRGGGDLPCCARLAWLARRYGFASPRSVKRMLCECARCCAAVNHYLRPSRCHWHALRLRLSCTSGRYIMAVHWGCTLGLCMRPDMRPDMRPCCHSCPAPEVSEVYGKQSAARWEGRPEHGGALPWRGAGDGCMRPACLGDMRSVGCHRFAGAGTARHCAVLC